MWDESTFQLSNFNGADFEVWEWISKFTSLLLVVGSLTYDGIK